MGENLTNYFQLQLADLIARRESRVFPTLKVRIQRRKQPLNMYCMRCRRMFQIKIHAMKRTHVLQTTHQSFHVHVNGKLKIVSKNNNRHGMAVARKANRLQTDGEDSLEFFLFSSPGKELDARLELGRNRDGLGRLLLT